jgi:hypothetical protein
MGSCASTVTSEPTHPQPTRLMSEPRARDIAVLLGSLRTAIGVTLLAAPSLAKLWVGSSGRGAGGRALSRSLAAREIVIGCGALLAISNPARLRGWLAAGAFCDGVDALTSARSRELPCFSRVLVALSSGAAATAGAAAALSLPVPGPSEDQAPTA